ncbi:MAG TPA: hypothetical protein VLA19_24135 [Herpetosiphonaceae bacterium]|nr:hypothetical protein [Herpetosiphonaceae bacterium]
MAEKDKAKDKADEQSAPEVKAKNITEEDRAFLAEHADQLSDTTVKYAKWIHTVDEHADRDGQSLATRSHEVIQRWAEERDAKPATVPDTGPEDRAGVLRFNFPGHGGRSLEEISWDDWFKPFDERELVFLYQERKSDGSQSNFFRLDNPEREDA